MTTTAVFITEQVDHAILTLDRLPRSSSLLECATCSTARGRHATPGGECESFTRPQLPPGHRYLDEVTSGTPVRLLGQPAADVELVAAIDPLKVGGRPMLRLVTHSPPSTWATPVTRYVSPDSIVAL